MSLIKLAVRLVAGRNASRYDRSQADNTTTYDPDLEGFLLQMSVLSDVRMKERARELSALGFERRQQGYEAAEQHLDYVLRCHSVAQDLRQRWLANLMHALRREVERQDLAQLLKRAAQGTPGRPPFPFVSAA